MKTLILLLLFSTNVSGQQPFDYPEQENNPDQDKPCNDNNPNKPCPIDSGVYLLIGVAVIIAYKRKSNTV